MKKRLLSVCVLMAVALTASAAEVDLATARQKARKFMQQKGRQLVEQPVRPSWRRSADGGRDAGFYVFNASEQGGFVIISADDATDDVLAWSDRGSFDYGRLPDHVLAWLDGYSRQLALIRSGEATALRRAGLAVHDTVKPMLATRWTQGSPFDDLCPMDISGRSATGCVATALGQIMKYHEWPKDSIPGISGYTSRSRGFELDSLPPTKFDWASMQNVYPQTYYFQPPSEKETKAVAELMRYVGQSVQMDYAFGGSSATYNDAARALKQYFGYDSDLKMLCADDYGLAEWEQMIYHELTTNGPVAYSGQSPTGDGHAFVIDGYEDQYYHVNWGWGGEIGPDGYYKLFLMNPQELGTGGGMSKEGFRLSQEAIVNFKPENGVKDTDYDRAASALVAAGERIAYQNGNIFFFFATETTQAETFDYALVRITGNGYDVISKGTSTAEPGYIYNVGYSALQLASWGHVKQELDQKGSCRITLVSKLPTSDEWVPVYDDETYFLLEKENGTLKVTPKRSDPSADIDVRATDFALEGMLLKGENLRVSFKLGQNTSEFRGGVRVLVNSEEENRYGILDTKYVALVPGEEDTFSGLFTAWRAGTYNVVAVLADNPAKELGSYSFTVKEMANMKAGDVVTATTDSTVWCRLPLTNRGTMVYDRTLKARLYQADRLIKEKTLTLALDSSRTANYEFLFDSLTTATDYQLRFFIDPHPYLTTESEIAAAAVNTNRLFDLVSVGGVEYELGVRAITAAMRVANNSRTAYERDVVVKLYKVKESLEVAAVQELDYKIAPDDTVSIEATYTGLPSARYEVRFYTLADPDDTQEYEMGRAGMILPNDVEAIQWRTDSPLAVDQEGGVYILFTSPAWGYDGRVKAIFRSGNTVKAVTAPLTVNAGDSTEVYFPFTPKTDEAYTVTFDNAETAADLVQTIAGELVVGVGLTAIGELTTDGQVGPARYFDLDGRPVQTPSRRGLYILQTAKGSRKVVGGR